ncbi:Argininosuccinate synthase [Diplonema papillatum]|nr:Argininosuccinate synthase [Diplonema papillatum]
MSAEGLKVECTGYSLQGSMLSPGSTAGVGSSQPPSEHSPKEGGRRAVTKLGQRETEEEKNVLVSFSGGLIGICLLRWLAEHGYRVAALVSDIGQNSDVNEIRQLAEDLGAFKVYVEDMKREFLSDFVIPSLMANATYEGGDMLGTALSRFAIARKQVQIAERDGFPYISHGCSGIGNDQCRFELTYAALYPQVVVVSPFREPGFREIAKTRRSMQEWCEAQGIAVPSSAMAEHSEDSNIYSTSHWGGSLDSPDIPAGDSAWVRTVDPSMAKQKPDKVSIHFKDGRPCKVVDLTTDAAYTSPVELFEFLGSIGGKHGVGRFDVVDNRFIGVKSRRIVECPAGSILLAAHQDIEGVAMDKEVARLRDMFTQKFAELVYSGFWFSPEMDFIQAAILKSQEVIDGVVTVRLHNGSVTPVSRSSNTTPDPASLPSLTPKEMQGYIKVNALRLSAHAVIMNKLNMSKQSSSASPKGHRTTAWRKSETESSSYNQFWERSPNRNSPVSMLHTS